MSLETIANFLHSNNIIDSPFNVLIDKEKRWFKTKGFLSRGKTVDCRQKYSTVMRNVLRKGNYAQYFLRMFSSYVSQCKAK